MVASLLCYTERIAELYTVLGASDTMCMAHAPIRGQILVNLVAGHTGPPSKEGAATRSDSKVFRGETSFGRYISIPSDLLERLNVALAITSSRTSYFRGIITHCQVSKC